jgi:hypothetical protein
MRTNRLLDLLGIPSLPARAFIKEGGKIKPQGGSSGGGSAQPSSQTITQTNIPEYARPYAEEMLGQGQALTDINQNPYQPYTDQRFAGFSPMQAQAFQNVAGQQVAPQLSDASNLAYTGAQQGLATQGTAQGLQQNALQYGGLGSQYGAVGAMSSPQAQQYGANAAGIGGIGVQQAQQGFGAGQAYAQQATSPEAMQDYMSPYMQNVVNQQQREAARTSQIQQQGIQAQATQQGAFGGSRSAIVDAERQRNLATQMGDIQGAGLQQAYQQAQQAQQFGANLGIQGLQAGYQGLNTGIQGQQTGLQGIQTGLQGTAQGIAGAQAGMQGVGQATTAGQYGLAGSQLGVQGAGTLGQLGQTQYGQEMGITDAQQKYGALQQQQSQQGLDFAYQQEMARQQYPYQQLSYMSDLLRGVPSSQSSQLQYSQQPNQTAQIIGGGLAAYGAFGRKEGGSIPKSYANGGQVTPDAMSTMAVQEIPAQLRRLSDTQLAAYARNVKDAITLSAIQSETQRRAKTRMPASVIPEDTTAGLIAKRAEEASIGQGMAGGGIIALYGGGGVEQDYGFDQASMVSTPPPKPFALSDYIPQGPYSGITTAGVGGTSAPVPQPKPQPTTPPENPAKLDGITITALAQKNNTLGIRGAAPTSRLTFDQFKAMSSQVEPNAEDQAVLADMRKRVDSRLKSAEGQKDTAAYDAIMMAGLAMMGGNSLADGIAKAAQVGGPTYLAGKKEATKAVNAAQDAQLAFDKYRMDLRRGDEEAARKNFNNYLGYTTDLAKIDATLSAATIRSGVGGVDGKDAIRMEKDIEYIIRNKFGDLEAQASMIKDAKERNTALAQIKIDRKNEEARLRSQAGLPTGAPGPKQNTSNDRASLDSFYN